MSLADRHVTALMRQLASQDVVELVHPFAEWETLGALAYIAECYGFRYADVRHVGKEKTVHVTMVRDPDPRAVQRAAANAAAFPQAGAGGPVPGMYQGSLTPVPEAQPDVDLIATLIRYDALGAAANRKQLLTMSWGIPLVLVLLAALTGKFAVLLTLAALVPAFLLITLRVNETRRAKLAERLTAAGCTPVRDEQGRERYVRA
ncbi:hypothetical protein BN159_3631 [Streptomyces davaonensis JCM 4913]|uniref:Integral membrane protein n=1 Tax=Streptomyces davaonensis (strain DSM 101723 / JCM 4913 / KCC S-0913 / 768) TaxID=1214101 RepID=K4R4L5_STRDJ|nr:hypothetical protein [Streptomyces davaonensis]CCK28010.1 hypothetical protein BN159_3631 [Streptomyces davaonensis JCM 4913]